MTYSDSVVPRVECIWCDPPHPLDGKGPVSAEEHAASSHGMCWPAYRRAMQALAQGPAPQELPLVHPDAAGAETRTWGLLFVIAVLAAMLGFALATALLVKGAL